MKKKYQIIGWLLLILVLSGIVAFYMFNKPAKNIATAHPEFSLTASELLLDFDTDETQANRNYLEKIIEVTGTVSEISFENNLGIITLADESMMASVICHVATEEIVNLKNIKQGVSITIKGVCTGYLMDVVLVKCVIKN